MKHMGITLNTSKTEVMIIRRYKYAHIARVATNHMEGDFVLGAYIRRTAKREIKYPGLSGSMSGSQENPHKKEMCLNWGLNS